MEQSKGRPATKIEVEAFTAIVNLQDENRELRLKILSLQAERLLLLDACQLILDKCQDVLYTARLEGVVKVVKAAVELAQPSPVSRSHANQEVET